MHLLCRLVLSFCSFHSSPDLISNVNTLFNHWWFKEEESEKERKKANASNPMKDFNYFPVNLHSFVSALQSAWARCECKNFQENYKRRHAHVIRWMGTVGESNSCSHSTIYPLSQLNAIFRRFFFHLHRSLPFSISLSLLLLFDNYLHCWKSG